MNEEYMKKILSLSNIAWKQYKKWAETPIDARNDKYWDKVVKDIRELVKEHTDENTKQFFTDTLNAYAGQLDKEASKQFRQERLSL